MTKLIDASLRLKIWKDTHGQDLTEYALMAGFLVACSGFTLPQVATSISTVFTNVVTMLVTGRPETAPGG